MIDRQLPSQDILNGVRHIAGWGHWFSGKVGKELGDERRRSGFRDKLRSIMSELEIDVSHMETREMFGGKYKITYVVVHRGAIQLEFTDLLRDQTDSRTLESVLIYHTGEWEQKLNTAYIKCLDLGNQWNSPSRLKEQNNKQLKKEEELRREQPTRKWLTGVLPAVLALHSITYVSEWWQSVLIFFGGVFVFRLFLLVWDFLKGRH